MSIAGLVVSTALKNMNVSCNVYSQYMEKKNMFQAANQAWFVGKLVINPEIIISVKGTWTLGIWVFTLW